MTTDLPDISDLSVNEGAEVTKEDVRRIKVDLIANPPLWGSKIGISSSESDNLAQLGLSELHLKDIVVEINRYFLSSGATIVYGGDLRQGGLTEILIELVDRYQFPERDRSIRLISYLAFPLSTSLSKEQEAQYAHRIKFIKVSPPVELMVTDPTVFLAPVGQENLYIWARSLTNMRGQMEKDCTARIFIGGLATGYKGRAPGILEEILISLEHETPIFLIGSFGGVVAEVISHLNDGEQLKATLHSLSVSDSYQSLLEQYESHGCKQEMDWPSKLLTRLQGGWTMVSKFNGLSIEENQRLATSNHVHEIIYYLLKGLILTKRII